MQQRFLRHRAGIARFFPPLRMLARPAVGIDISDSSVKFLELVERSGVVAVGRFGERAIPQGVVLGGHIKDDKRLAQVLAALRKDQGLSYVCAALPEEDAYLFQTHIPNATEQTAARSMIEFQIEEHVPLSSAEVLFDYEKIGSVSREGERAVAVTVYPKAAAAAYAKVFSDAGLDALSYEVEAQAVSRAIIPSGDPGTYLMVDFGRARTGLGIVREGVLLFTATIDVGGDDITEAIMKTFKVSPEEAEQIKNERGFTRASGNDELFAALMSTVSALQDEINRHLVFWASRIGERGSEARPIESIVLCGGNANLRGLTDYLAKSLRLPTRVADVWTNTFSYDDYIPPIDREHSLGYATAIGLALRGAHLHD